MVLSTVTPSLPGHVPIKISDIQAIAGNGVGGFTHDVTDENNAVLVRFGICQCGCGKSFISTSPRQKYFDNKHKQRAYRRRKNSPKTRLNTCLHCKGAMPSNKRKSAKFCCGSCRQLSYRARRSSMVKTWAMFAKVDIETSADCVEKAGARFTGNMLMKAGYSYDYGARSWVQGVAV